MPPALPLARLAPRVRRLLVISNGHGEDSIGATLAQSLRAEGGDAVAIDAWPMVGEGEAYAAAGVTCVAKGLQLPGEGFGTLSVRAFVRDLRAGWIQGHIRQWQTARALRRQYALALAVGDIVPMLAAHAAATPFALVGCAKSVYYGRAGAYTPFERWLLRRGALACYPRDQKTTDVLVGHGLPARYLGNPMMDRIHRTGNTTMWRDRETVVAVLPGSRRDREANALRVLRMIADQRERYVAAGPIHFAFTLAPGFDLHGVRTAALADRSGVLWTPGSDVNELRCGSLRATFSVGTLGDVLGRSRVAIALAGTANEQAVGLGTPVVTFATDGPQGSAYLDMKMPFFGESAVRVAPRSREVSQAVVRILTDDVLHARMQRAGRARMGQPGAATAIARDVLTRLSNLATA